MFMYIYTYMHIKYRYTHIHIYNTYIERDVDMCIHGIIQVTIKTSDFMLQNK